MGQILRHSPFEVQQLFRREHGDDYSGISVIWDARQPPRSLASGTSGPANISLVLQPLANPTQCCPSIKDFAVKGIVQRGTEKMGRQSMVTWRRARTSQMWSDWRYRSGVSSWISILWTRNVNLIHQGTIVEWIASIIAFLDLIIISNRSCLFHAQRSISSALHQHCTCPVRPDHQDGTGTEKKIDRFVYLFKISVQHLRCWHSKAECAALTIVPNLAARINIIQLQLVVELLWIRPKNNDDMLHSSELKSCHHDDLADYRDTPGTTISYKIWFRAIYSLWDLLLRHLYVYTREILCVTWKIRRETIVHHRICFHYIVYRHLWLSACTTKVC